MSEHLIEHPYIWPCWSCMFRLATALQVAWATLAGQAAGGQESAAPEPGLGRHDIVILRAPGSVLSAFRAVCPPNEVVGAGNHPATSAFSALRRMDVRPA